jgi:hypothetical protein
VSAVFATTAADPCSVVIAGKQVDGMGEFSWHSRPVAATGVQYLIGIRLDFFKGITYLLYS